MKHYHVIESAPGMPTTDHGAYPTKPDARCHAIDTLPLDNDNYNVHQSGDMAWLVINKQCWPYQVYTIKVKSCLKSTCGL